MCMADRSAVEPVLAAADTPPEAAVDDRAVAANEAKRPRVCHLKVVTPKACIYNSVYSGKINVKVNAHSNWNAPASEHGIDAMRGKTQLRCMHTMMHWQRGTPAVDPPHTSNRHTPWRIWHWHGYAVKRKWPVNLLSDIVDVANTCVVNAALPTIAVTVPASAARQRGETNNEYWGACERLVWNPFMSVDDHCSPRQDLPTPTTCFVWSKHLVQQNQISREPPPRTFWFWFFALCFVHATWRIRIAWISIPRRTYML
jgi:hypothetical protein